MAMRGMLVYPQGAVQNPDGSWNGDYYDSTEIDKAPAETTHIVVMPNSSRDGMWTYGAPNQSTVSTNVHNSFMNFIAEFKQSNLHLVKGLKLYICTPYINTGDATSRNNMDAFYGNIKTFWDNLKASMGTDWDTLVEGCVLPFERIWGTIDPANPLNNQGVKLVNDCSYLVRTTYAKKLMYIPYYGSGDNTTASEIITNIGQVVNKMNLLDYCIIQPSWFWEGGELGNGFNRDGSADSDSTGNVDGVYYSAYQNEVTFRTGTPANGGRDSSHMLCRVGIEMECDTNIFRNGMGYANYDDAQYASNGTFVADPIDPEPSNYPNCHTRWNDCETRYRPLKNDANIPFCFYVGGKYGFTADPATKTLPDSHDIMDTRTIPTIISQWLNS